MSKYYFILFLVLVFLSHTSQAQLTSKDFKILLDGKDLTKDSHISVEDLLKVKEVTGNFNWLVIKSVDVYCGRDPKDSSAICSIPVIASCKGNTICDDARNNMKRLRSTNMVIIAVQATNKSGYPLQVPDLFLHIK